MGMQALACLSNKSSPAATTIERPPLVHRWSTLNLVLSVLSFHYVYALTFIHSAVTLLGMWTLAAVGMFEVKVLGAWQVVPLAAAFVGYVVLWNLSLQLNPVGFYQLAKIAITPAVIAIEAAFYAKRPTLAEVAAVAVLCSGVTLGTVSDDQVTTNMSGLAAALAAIACTAVYQIWAGAKQKELGAGSMQLMHQFQPLATGLLALLVVGVEPLGLPGTPHALEEGTILGYEYTPVSVAAILTTAVLGLLVSLSTFLVIGATSSVTFNVVSHLKTVVILAGGYLLFDETMSAKKLGGVVLGMSGVVWYSYLKGTQSSRFTLYNNDAHIVAKFQLDFPQHRTRAGWCEHDPLEIWDSVCRCIEGALAAALSEHGAIRVDHFRPVTGLPVSTYFSAYKWRWLRENVPAVAEAAAQGRCMLGTMDAWLLYQLTGGAEGGVFVTDVSNASRTGLMDLASLSWHAPALRYFGVPADALPQILSNAEVYGRVASGPLAGVPITGCLGDQQAAVLGQRCAPGTVKSTYGTGCFVLLHTGPRPVASTHGLLTTVAHRLGPRAEPQYALEGAIATAGAAVSWLIEGLGLIGGADELEPLARSVDSTDGVFFVPAFSGLLAPHWRPDARGAILGLTGSSSAAHVCRALLEALAWQTREVVDAMRADAGCELRLLRADGGASRNGLLMQLQADALQVEVRRPADLETTSLGAAFAAGIGSGFWTEEWVLGRASQKQEHDTIFEPQVGPDAAEARYAKWRRAVAHSLDLDQLAD
ncbi:hypothetical protein WJX81_001779 [Elliptochloris bilobata]|uniref:glycerol kinase n=1 Tax=Elliptochloris bilobata TaxID=381761 RepID=A0AAW1RNJ2_9CHLO